MAIHEDSYFTKEIRQLIVKSGAEVDEEKLRIQARMMVQLTLENQVWKR